MNAWETWCEGRWNNWRWKTPDHWSSSSSCSWTLQAGTQYPWMGHWERHSLWSNQWNRPLIPTFDGADFRQYKRRIRLFASNTQVAPDKRACKLLKQLEGVAFESCEGLQDLETENLLEHLRIHFEPIEVFRRVRLWTTPSATSSVSQVRKSRSTSHGETPCSRRFLTFTCPECTQPEWWRPRMKRTKESRSSRKMRLSMMSWRSSTRVQWP